jgi:hypothetical protein
LHNDVLDGTLNVLATATRMCICSAQPTTYTEAITTYKLAIHTLTGADFTNADGDTSGRKCTVAQQTGITVDSSGTATYLALCVAGTTTLLAVTSITSQAITATNTLTVNAFKLTLPDPT